MANHLTVPSISAPLVLRDLGQRGVNRRRTGRNGDTVLARRKVERLNAVRSDGRADIQPRAGIAAQ